MNSNEMSQFLVSNIQQYGSIAKQPAMRKNVFSNVRASNNECISVIDTNEANKWKYVTGCNDSKELWRSINMKGKIKPESNDAVQVDELENCCINKSTIDVSQTIFQDILTDVQNEQLDKNIEQVETEEALEE